MEAKRIADYITIECLLCYIYIDNLLRNSGFWNVFKQEHDC